MPTVVVGAAISAAASGAVAAITGASILTAALTSGALSLITGGLSMLLAPKPPKSSGSFGGPDQSGLTRQVRQPISNRKILYGEVRASGPLAFITSTDTNKYLHMVVLLADHEVEEIGETFVNEESVPDSFLDVDGMVTDGTYKDKMWIKKHLGTDTQVAEPDLVGINGWTTDHRLLGIAYVYVRLEWDRALFPGGIPGMSWWVRGKKVFDPRDSGTRFTMNPTLFVRDYFIDTKRGVGAPSTRMDDNEIISSANICEEFVTCVDLDVVVDEVDPADDTIIFNTDDTAVLQYVRGDRVRVLTSGTAPGGTATGTDYYVIPVRRRGTPTIKLATTYANALASTAIDITSMGTGTHTIRRIAEPRYGAGGTLDTSVQPDKNLVEMLSAMAGNAIYSSGKWRVLAGAYASPTVSFNEDNLIGSFTTQTRQSKRDRFNRVKGIYAAPVNVGQPTDYPIFNSLIRQTEDGEVITTELNLPWTQRPQTAQRLCKIASERMRQEIVFTADFDIKAMQVRAGENISFTFTRYGWVDKPFEILSWVFNVREVDGVPVPFISMTLKETASTIYDFTSATEESPVDPAPNTVLPDPFFVSAPTSLAVRTETFFTTQMDTVSYIVLSWAEHPNAFVVQGGSFEVQFKKTADTDWSPSYMIDGAQTFTPIYGVIDQVNYDVQIRAVNNLGRVSTWSLISGFTIGAPSSGATVLLDYQLFSIAEDVFLVYGSFQDTLDPINLEIDYGEFT